MFIRFINVMEAKGKCGEFCLKASRKMSKKWSIGNFPGKEIPGTMWCAEGLDCQNSLEFVVFYWGVGNGAGEEALSQVERNHVCFAVGVYLLFFRLKSSNKRLVCLDLMRSCPEELTVGETRLKKDFLSWNDKN